ncbi:MAG: hypothetical protein JW993_16485 [Sedimentisphaerales bacterium]|nr:hypothetical protein [Sedimentisphaerales bacterium]
MSEEEKRAAASEPDAEAPGQTREPKSPAGDTGEVQAEDAAAVYPLRPASEDPRWAVGVVWTWVSIAVGLLLFLVTLMVLGFWYD